MASQQRNYDVFISFSGEDTRNNLLCHLNDALSRKGLRTFVDDRLQRGEEINSALLQAIQDSKVAVIIFSKNYASSSWCLDELLKITECRETHNQIVIPVFYHVDPSHVRKQNGKFGELFKQHSENPRNDSKKIEDWKDALKKAANLSGWDSAVIRKDNALIDQIVKDISKKLEPFYPRSLEGFVGLDRKISQVKTLIATISSDVRVLGIWGMGGIGKTTLAEAIFNQVSSQFESHCFLSNVREALEKKGKKKLLKQLISNLLGERDMNINTENIVAGLQRLKCKPVCVVFDDVSGKSQLEPLIGTSFCCFRTGSIIIITSRDKQVFKGITDNIYEVDTLSYTESCEVFVKNAYPSQDHIPFLDSFVNYAGGNPLAIKVLGSYVCGKGVELWKDALNKLSNCANQNIQNVLKLSYDGLDREQKVVFLHIACFFNGENINDAKRVLNSCRLSADSGVRDLVDKSLLTISDMDELDMHELLQEMGREIVRQESSDPGQRSRLWDCEEIRNVLEKNKGTEAIESITLKTSEIRDIVIDPDVFKRMPNLKFLRFYTSWGERSKVHLTRGLHFLPSGVRYLYWDEYPLGSLPADFDAKELLVLHLGSSKNIKQILKDGKDAGKLRAVAHFLIESPLICHVTNIASGILRSGIGQFFSKITSLDMGYCQNLKSFPSNVDLPCLEILNVEGCSNLEILPVISTELRKLNVGDTAIREVHSSSIERLSRLEDLNMGFCFKLESLPSNICKLQALQRLGLHCCSRLKKFPEIVEPMYNLRKVVLSFSGIEVIPSSIDNLKGLEDFSLNGCLNLAIVPESFGNLMRRLSNFSFSTLSKQRKLQNNTDHSQSELPRCLNQSEPQNLLHFEDSECFYFDISSHLQDSSEDLIVGVDIKEKRMKTQLAASKLVYCLSDLPSHPYLRFSLRFSSSYVLDLSECCIRELPKDLGSLYYLTRLDLSSNNFEEIPASIKQLSLLEYLRLDDCPKLRYLQQLPSGLVMLSAARCKSLKTLLTLKQPIFNGGELMFNFSDCLKLGQKECELMAYRMLRNPPKVRNEPKEFFLCYPRSTITEWFRHQTTGDKIRITLPSNWSVNRKIFGFAFCIVFDSRRIVMSNTYVEFECHFEDNCNPTIRFTYQTNFILDDLPYYDLRHQHVLVWCLHDFNVWISERRQLFGLHCINMASFKFYTKNAEHGEIKKCGITPLYMQDDEDDDGEDEYDDDENAYRMLESLMSTNEDDDEDMNSGADEDMNSENDEDSEDADDIFSEDYEDLEDAEDENADDMLWEDDEDSEDANDEDVGKLNARSSLYAAELIEDDMFADDIFSEYDEDSEYAEDEDAADDVFPTD